MKNHLPSGSPSRQRIAQCLSGESGRAVDAAVRAVVGRGRPDVETLVDEVRQELALRMLRGRFDSFNPRRGDFRAYLTTAARNLARNLLRSSRPVLEPVEATMMSPPDRALLEAERRAGLHRALSELERESPADAGLLRGRYLEGLAWEEVSRRTGVPSRNIHVRAHRARRRLATILEPSGFHD